MQRSKKVTQYIVLIGVLLIAGLQPVLPVAAQATEPSQEQKGLLETGLYESPQFSNEVAWSTLWELDDEGLRTDGSLLVDQLSLNYENQGTAVIMFIEAAGEAPDDYARRLTRYRRVAEPTAQVVWNDSDDTTSVLLYQTLVDGRDVASLIEIRLVDDNTTLQVVELLLYPEYAATVFDSAQAEIAIDGEPPFTLVTEFPEDELID